MECGHKSLSSYTWKCPTKLFLDPCEMFDKGGNRFLLSLVQFDACWTTRPSC